jgi:putative endonuclease
MAPYNKALGVFGEQLAVDYLVRQQCRIVARNVRTSHGEIDIVADNGHELIFCEVKTRTSISYGYPEGAVDERKSQHITLAAQTYLQREGIERFWRIDIISVLIDRDQKKAHFRWFKNITS